MNNDGMPINKIKTEKRGFIFLPKLVIIMKLRRVNRNSPRFVFDENFKKSEGKGFQSIKMNSTRF